MTAELHLAVRQRNRERAQWLMRAMRLMGLEALGHDQPAVGAAPNLPLLAARSGDRSAESDIGCRHHLNLDGPGLPLPDRMDGLAPPVCLGLASVEHERRPVPNDPSLITPMYSFPCAQVSICLIDPVLSVVQMPTLGVYHGLDELPSGCRWLFDTHLHQDFALCMEWFRNMIANGLSPRTEAWFGVLSEGTTPVGVLPLQRQGKELRSLTNCYTCYYTPLISPIPPLVNVARGLGRELGRICGGQSSVRLDALPANWSGLDSFIEGVQAGGLLVRRFDHFGNWYERIGGRSWEDYLASRSGGLRELLRRKRRQAARHGQIAFEIIDAEGDLPRGITAYEAVYSRSWKPTEPFPSFNAGLIREAARLGVLRLGICWHGKDPIAAQLWIAVHGSATVMKLAHDQAYDMLSPGTLLTAEMIKMLVEEGIEEIDFGRGDDHYKSLWVKQRRQRIGLLLLNPRRFRGLASLARHDCGRLIKVVRRRIGENSGAT